MKKLLACALALTMLLAVGCAPRPDKTEPNAPLKVFAPDGAPAFALSGLMGDDTYDIEVVPASTIGSKITTKEADLLIIPTNAVVNLFNKGQDYRIIAEATRGNLYLVGKTDSETPDLSDLTGAVAGVIGSGQTPDLVLRYILSANGIGYETSDAPVSGKAALKYYADGPSVIKALKAGQIGFGLLGEPAATNAAVAVSNVKVMDVQALFEQAEDGNAYGFPQAVLAVKYATYTARRADVDAFVNAYAAAKNYAADNPADAVARVKAHMQAGTEASIQSLTAEVARRCNIANGKITAAVKTDIANYIQMILDLEQGQDVSSVGGKLPDESIYIVE